MHSCSSRSSFSRRNSYFLWLEFVCFTKTRFQIVHICSSKAFFRPTSDSRILSFRNGFFAEVFLIASAAHSASNGSSRMPAVVSRSSGYVVAAVVVVVVNDAKLTTLSFVDQLKSWTSKNLSTLPFWWFSFSVAFCCCCCSLAEPKPFCPAPMDASDPLEMPELKTFQNFGQNLFLELDQFLVLVVGRLGHLAERAWTEI